MVKLHLGCGSKYLPGYVHVDVTKHEHVDVCCSILDLEAHFAAGSVDEVYACHVLEHLSRHDVDRFFKVCGRVMKLGGLLRLAVPDVQQVMNLYQNGTPLYPKLYGLLWGGQRDSYDYHTCGFDFDTLRTFAGRHGFGDMQRYQWQDFLPEGYDDFSRCYIPHMDFENGTLMSLNVTCAKKPPMLIYCTGGLANAVNSLIAGVHYARSHGLELHVHWVEGYIALDVKLKDIFEIKDASISFISEGEFLEMLRGANDALILTHNHSLAHIQGVKGKLVHTSHIPGLPSDFGDHDLVFFHIDALPHYVQSDPMPYFDAFFSAFAFRRELEDAAREFLEAQAAQIGRPITCGVHVRGTDMLALTGRTHDGVYEAMRSLAERNSDALPILVCTDDAKVRKRLEEGMGGSFVFYDHDQYVERRDDNLAWCHDEGTDHIHCGAFEHGGKQYKHYSWTNVYRPTSQVLAGVIDLILLASMQRLHAYETSSGSTFFRFAQLLQLHRTQK